MRLKGLWLVLEDTVKQTCVAIGMKQFFFMCLTIFPGEVVSKGKEENVVGE
jgi:hypothetical protein